MASLWAAKRVVLSAHPLAIRPRVNGSNPRRPGWPTTIIAAVARRHGSLVRAATATARKSGLTPRAVRAKDAVAVNDTSQNLLPHLSGDSMAPRRATACAHNRPLFARLMAVDELEAWIPNSSFVTQASWRVCPCAGDHRHLEDILPRPLSSSNRSSDLPCGRLTQRARTRLMSTPTRHLVGPSLAAVLPECDPTSPLRDLNTLGYRASASSGTPRATRPVGLPVGGGVSVSAQGETNEQEAGT